MDFFANSAKIRVSAEVICRNHILTCNDQQKDQSMSNNKSITKAYLDMLREKEAEFIDEIIIKRSEEHLDPRLHNFSESRWMDSLKSGWSYRIDPQNTNTKTQKHVHVARTKHVNSPRQQASWNIDKTRHDKRNFNPNIGSKNIAQQIAIDALNLPDDVVLECFSLKSDILLLESDNPEGVIFCFSVK